MESEFYIEPVEIGCNPCWVAHILKPGKTEGGRNETGSGWRVRSYRMFLYVLHE
jgi:hypothetical protein